jgi:hypothetical protein
MKSKIRFDVCKCHTRGIFVLCHHVIVNLFVRKPELNGANLPNFDLNSCHFCPIFFCPPTVQFKKNCDCDKKNYTYLVICEMGAIHFFLH